MEMGLLRQDQTVGRRTVWNVWKRTLVYKVKKESPAGKRQIERLVSLLARHKLSIPIEVDSMSKNEVSRLTDQIVAKYGR